MSFKKMYSKNNKFIKNDDGAYINTDHICIIRRSPTGSCFYLSTLLSNIIGYSVVCEKYNQESYNILKEMIGEK